MPERRPEYIADLPSSRPTCFSDLGRVSTSILYPDLQYSLAITEDSKEICLRLAVRIMPFHSCAVSCTCHIPNDDKTYMGP